MSEGRSFWSTIPGVVSGVAAILTAVVGLVTVGVQLGWFGGDDDGGAGDANGATTTTVAGRPGTTGRGGSGGSGAAGSGGSAQLVADKARLTFAPLQTREMTVTIRNDGNAPVTLARPQIEGADSDQYSAAYTNCPTPLGAGRSCTVTVTFRPTEPGQSRATLVVEPSSGDADPVEVAIEGNHLL